MFVTVGFELSDYDWIGLFLRQSYIIANFDQDLWKGKNAPMIVWIWKQYTPLYVAFRIICIASKQTFISFIKLACFELFIQTDVKTSQPKQFD